MAKISNASTGFGEEQQRDLAGAPLAAAALGFDEPHAVGGARLKIGPGGRVVIPAEIRQALGVAEGDTLLATVADGEVRLMSSQSALQRARALVRQSIPAGVSLVDDLLAERRREVERDLKRGR